ncbi:hypothetical protein SAMN05421505_1756 [Sinosporangium album]|uniref:Uncharacterized protein n=1 Tax=Sinosporangium album TaxID=504805 RepID=A0A1G8LQR7_9ACTN|nr:hypothetical protein [Sinosporangium album]SDI57955.1 hypothetical protein SAMN05421505_1756 [Sinosporangium album]
MRARACPHSATNPRPAGRFGNWIITARILGSGCVLPYGGGNTTSCIGGLSKEQTIGAAALIALVLFVIQIGLIVLAGRRIRSGPRGR